jgi:S-DNA-T family DNA segregation ATPase FtsK/SpoIIIE
MINLKILEKRVNEIEERLKKVEEGMASPLYTDDKELMDALYKKARELVVKHHKASVIFLQRKLIIDYARAEKLLDELEMNGVIGPELGAESRKILVKE